MWWVVEREWWEGMLEAEQGIGDENWRSADGWRRIEGSTRLDGDFELPRKERLPGRLNWDQGLAERKSWRIDDRGRAGRGRPRIGAEEMS